MNKKVQKQIESFFATSDSGKRYALIVMQAFILDDSWGTEPTYIPNEKWIITSTGKKVNQINEDTFSISSGMEEIILTREK